MSIGANTIQDDGKMLVITINVVYEWVDYIGYQVSSAKLNAYETLATGDGTFTGDVGVGGDLEVTGDASVGGDLSVTGDVEVGADSKVKIYGNITDADGNPRFVDGDITIDSGLAEKVESAYSKWTLSGSHLMIVCMFKVLEDFTASGTNLAKVTIPSWLYAKIYPMGNTNHISVIDSLYGYYPNNLSASAGAIRPYLAKNVGDYQLDITIESGNLEEDKYYRVVFDLVIE